jgi:hypothetical protein
VTSRQVDTLTQCGDVVLLLPYHILIRGVKAFNKLVLRPGRDSPDILTDGIDDATVVTKDSAIEGRNDI